MENNLETAEAGQPLAASSGIRINLKTAEGWSTPTCAKQKTLGSGSISSWGARSAGGILENSKKLARQLIKFEIYFLLLRKLDWVTKSLIQENLILKLFGVRNRLSTFYFQQRLVHRVSNMA